MGQAHDPAALAVMLRTECDAKPDRAAHRFRAVKRPPYILRRRLRRREYGAIIVGTRAGRR